MKIPVRHIIVAALLLSSCSYFQSKEQHEKVIAVVDGKELKMSDMAGIFPEGISGRDSLELLKNHVNSWVRKCVMANNAEEHLDNSRKNIAYEVDDFRMSLLIYRYETQYLEKELDTLVSEQDLLACYELDPGNLPAPSKPMVKITYIKLDNNTVGIGRIKQALDESKSRQYIDSVCALFSVHPDYLSDQWYDLNFVDHNFPFTTEQREALFRNNDAAFMEVYVDGIIHLLAFREIRRKTETPSVEQLRKQYYATIINKRRRELIRKLENDAYTEALDSQRLKIYINE